MTNTEIKNIYDNKINTWNLAIVPSFEEFENFMSYDGTNKNDIDEIERAADLFLSDFTEKKIKTKMFSEHKRINMNWKDVRKFENDGGSIIIGGTLEQAITDERNNIEHLSISEKNDFLENYNGDIEKYLESWSKACVDEVKYGVVIEIYW